MNDGLRLGLLAALALMVGYGMLFLWLWARYPSAWAGLLG